MSHPTRALLRCLSWLLTAGLLTNCAEEKASITVGDAAAATATDGGAPGKDVSGASTSVELAIDDGPLKGKLVGATRQFLGIPYAKPPIGDLRWQPPQPVAKWTTARSATEFGKRCAQIKSEVLMNAASEDEDCLYLNVFTPKSAKALPVMLWIHGGGNVNGSASEPVPYAQSGLFYDGSILSEKGVVVVTINYRLGVFGFFDHAGLGAKGGNQGLLDQVATMQWVKNNIAKFGGDPTNVTIFGESAGSLDVCLHVASPKSRGLFHKAISQSGGCTTLTTTKALAVENAGKFAASLECEGEGKEAVDCLRKKTVPELIAGSPPDVFSGRAFGPDIDGVFLTEQVRSSYDSGDIAKVPFMLGSNSDEGTLFTLATKVEDQAAYDALLTTAFGAIALEPIKALYPIDKFMDGLPNPFAAAYARVLGDSRLVCSTTDAAIRAVAAGSTVYMYNFDIPVPATVSPVLGASHGAELTSVFGTSPAFTEEAKAASEMIQRYWTNFAKTGNPNGGDDLEWPARTTSSDVRINLAFESTIVDDFRAAECEFWRAGYARQFPAP